MGKNVRFNLNAAGNHKVDVMFLADATGSMGPCMNDVKTNIISSFNAFKKTVNWDIQLGIAFYRDQSDATPFQVLQTITGNETYIQAAASKLIADGGGDRPEAQIAALAQLGSRKVAGWRAGATRILAWFGDEPAHNPVTVAGVTYTLASATEALLEHNIQACAFSMAPSNRLDETNQATQLTEQVDGVTDNRFVQYNVKQTGVVKFILDFIRGDVP